MRRLCFNLIGGICGAVCLGSCTGGEAANGIRLGKSYENDVARYIFNGDSVDVYRRVFGDYNEHTRSLIVKLPSGDYLNVWFYRADAEREPNAAGHYYTNVNSELDRFMPALTSTYNYYFRPEQVEQMAFAKGGDWVQIVDDAPATMEKSSVSMTWTTKDPRLMQLFLHEAGKTTVFNVESDGLVIRSVETEAVFYLKE